MSIISKLALLLCFQVDLKCPFTCCNGEKALKGYLKSELIAKGLISSKCGKWPRGIQDSILPTVMRDGRPLTRDENQDSFAADRKPSCASLLPPLPPCPTSPLFPCPNKLPNVRRGTLESFCVYFALFVLDLDLKPSSGWTVSRAFHLILRNVLLCTVHSIKKQNV